MEKTLAIKRAEFTSNLVKLVNESQLPAFIVSDVLTILLNEVDKDAEVQLKRELEAYRSSAGDDPVSSQPAAEPHVVEEVVDLPEK